MGLLDRRRGKADPQAAFAAEVTKVARALLPVRSVEAHPDFSLHLGFADGRTDVLYLGNIYAEITGLDSDARAERVRRAVLMFADGDRPQTWEEARDRILPAVRAMSWVAASGEVSPVWAPFVPFLARLAAVDAEHAMSFVTEADLRRWGVEAASVESTGRENLLRDGVPVGAEGDRGPLEILGPDGYVASWLTLPDVLEHVAQEALGDHVVALAPSRDRLRLVPTADPVLLQVELERGLSDYESAVRAVSPVPYDVTGGRATPWVPPPGHPCEAFVDRANRVLALVEYEEQHSVLSDLFEKAGEDVFVAKYNLVERPDTTVWSWSVWVKQVTAGLLPQADYLALADNETQQEFWVRWEDAERIAGNDLRPEPGYYPPRWRVSGWPDAGELAALRQTAVDGPGGS